MAALFQRGGPANTGQALGGHNIKPWWFLEDVCTSSLVCFAVFNVHLLVMHWKTDHAHLHACC